MFKRLWINPKKLEVESFGKICWLVLWADQVLTKFDSFEIFNAHGTDKKKICHEKICLFILSGYF